MERCVHYTHILPQSNHHYRDKLGGRMLIGTLYMFGLTCKELDSLNVCSVVACNQTPAARRRWKRDLLEHFRIDFTFYKCCSCVVISGNTLLAFNLNTFPDVFCIRCAFSHWKLKWCVNIMIMRYMVHSSVSEQDKCFHTFLYMFWCI